MGEREKEKRRARGCVCVDDLNWGWKLNAQLSFRETKKKEKKNSFVIEVIGRIFSLSVFAWLLHHTDNWLDAIKHAQTHTWIFHTSSLIGALKSKDLATFFSNPMPSFHPFAFNFFYITRIKSKKKKKKKRWIKNTLWVYWWSKQKLKEKIFCLREISRKIIVKLLRTTKTRKIESFLKTLFGYPLDFWHIPRWHAEPNPWASHRSALCYSWIGAVWTSWRMSRPWGWKPLLLSHCGRAPETDPQWLSAFDFPVQTLFLSFFTLSRIFFAFLCFDSASRGGTATWLDFFFFSWRFISFFFGKASKKFYFDFN